VNGISRSRGFSVPADGKGVVPLAGVVAVQPPADRVGLTDRLSSALTGRGAGSAARLPASGVASADPGEVVVLDTDATLVTAHSEKEKAKPTFKGGLGLHESEPVIDPSQQLHQRRLKGEMTMTDVPVDGRAPLFSFVVAVYNVEKYLPEFLESIDALDFPTEDLELIFVDDGSQDGSAALIGRWIPTCRFATCMLQKRNGGPGSARNAGLARARGRWVSFPDPDDVLGRDYLRVVAAYVGSERSAEAAMIAARPIQFVDDASSPISPHPLDFKYADGERLVDLERSPRFVHLHTHIGFYRTDLIRAQALRFDEEVRPIFEDAVFNVDYLAHAKHPTVAFLGAASYFYRRRADQGSLTSTAWQDRATFDKLPEKGYLALLERSGRPVPRWIQNIVYYDLQWHFKADARLKSGMANLSSAALEHFHDLLDQVLEYLDESTLLEFHAIDIPVRIRLGLVARKTGAIPAQSAYVTKLDRAQGRMQVSYFTAQPRPVEDIRLDETPIRPTYAKTTSIRYFGRAWLYQRDLWLPSERPVSLRVGGRLMPIVYGMPAAAVFETSPREVWQRFAHQPPPDRASLNARTNLWLETDCGRSSVDTASASRGTRAIRHLVLTVERWLREQASRPAIRLARRMLRAATWSARLALSGVLPVTASEPGRAAGLAEAVRRRAANPAVRRRFRQAWVLIDRDSSAQDNAEAFYRYLRQNRPEVNAWFALSRTSPDWARLKREGFRLIEFSSIDYALALRNATYLISSQADDYLVRPRGALYGRRTSKFVFLQHGVIHNDLSRWLNSRSIRIMITTTEAEHRSIVADKTPYLLSENEVELTGLPRHDQLLAKARRLPADCRRSLLVAPTWRDYLLGPQGIGHQRELAVDLADSPFFEGWRNLLASPDLIRLIQHEALDLVFLAHPHLQKHVTAGLLPPHVRIVTPADADIQDVIARARVMITDYSSIVFDAAYIGTPAVYYQFDAEEFFSGRHTVRAGEFSYIRDGFGPVVADPAAVVTAVADLLDPESQQLAEYRRRMEETFTFRDGRCCERVYAAIKRRELPLPDTVGPPRLVSTRTESRASV
jgi:glycosyltransferase involved in cell wall biosynthesis/CDP-glycerol glycerophosphotransferase (TagB/SpsB family)